MNDRARASKLAHFEKLLAQVETQRQQYRMWLELAPTLYNAEWAGEMRAELESLEETQAKLAAQLDQLLLP